MKKIFSLLLFVILLTSCSTTGTKEYTAGAELIPLDPAVASGVLENGMHYYIRENSEPRNRIVLRLVLNAGSVLEDEDQLGLAHLVEHMAFNGTVKFEKHEIINYLEKTGMKFGADINAHTGFDETVYKISIPADDPSMLETGLEILKEWAFEITFNDDEVDKERGVVVEEWRAGRGASARMRDKYLPVLFHGSRYAERLPIGSMDIIQNSSYSSIRRYYEEWYRPDLMAVVVVGEVDTESVINQIGRIFGSYKKRTNPRLREEFQIPDTSSRQYSIISDSEASVTNLQIIYKLKREAENTLAGYRSYIKGILTSIMFDQRLGELINQGDPPFIYGSAGYSSLVRTKSAFSLSAVVGDNGVERAFRALIEEQARFLKYGFTEPELDRSKKIVLSYIKSIYQERNSTESVNFAGELSEYFLDGVPSPGIEWEWEKVRSILPELSIKDFIPLAEEIRTGSSPVIIITGPDQDSVRYPSADELDAIFNDVMGGSIDTYEDSFTGSDLMSDIPEPGSVITRKFDENGGFYIWELSNGSIVAFKETDFKNDEVLFSAFSPGGSSLVEDDEYFSATIAASLIKLSGLGNFNNVEINKVLAGKQVAVTPYIGTLFEGFSGSAVPGDLGTLFQLINLYFTGIRKDDTAYQSFMNRLDGLVKNRESKPEVVFQDAVRSAVYNNHFRSQALSSRTLLDVSEEEAYRVFRERFANPGDFIFLFTGNIPDNFESLVLKYIASIPGNSESEIWIDRNMDQERGVNTLDMHVGIEPKSTVVILFSGKYEWSLENNNIIYGLKDLLNIRLREEIREELSGTYGVRVSVRPGKFPKDKYSVSINFSCAPDRVAELTERVFEVIDELKTSSVSEDNITKIKEGFRRGYEESLRENSYWLGVMDAVFRYNLESGYILDKSSRINAVTSDLLMEAADRYLDMDNYFKAVLYPEE
ncbi:MAG: insulinase family protein [Spirochaetales bacterium]|nr:insulinase family protein [Spirochaetales bacterium]